MPADAIGLLLVGDGGRGTTSRGQRGGSGPAIAILLCFARHDGLAGWQRSPARRVVATTLLYSSPNSGYAHCAARHVDPSSR
jgi:hypothetical protein